MKTLENKSPHRPKNLIIEVQDNEEVSEDFKLKNEKSIKTKKVEKEEVEIDFNEDIEEKEVDE